MGAGDVPDDWEGAAFTLGFDLPEDMYGPTPWEPAPGMYGWRQRREHPNEDDLFTRRHLRFKAAWAVSDLEEIYRGGWLKRALVCWWAHRRGRMCVVCASGWVLS